MISNYVPMPFVASQVMHSVPLVALTPTPPLSISVTSSPDYVMDILTAVYVALTLIIAIVAIWSVREGRNQSKATLQTVNSQIEESKKQAEQERFDKVLPFLIPMDAPVFQGSHRNWLKWEEPIQDITFNNMGVGIALNIASVLLGCKSYNNDPGKPRIPGVFDEHWTLWLNAPIPPSGKVKCAYKVNNGLFREENRQVAGYLFFAPQEPEPDDLNHGVFLHITARLIITYQDIFSRKYASIYDYVNNIGWLLVKFTPIEKDLYALEGSNSKRNTVEESLRVTYFPSPW